MRTYFNENKLNFTHNNFPKLMKETELLSQDCSQISKLTKEIIPNGISREALLIKEIIDMQIKFKKCLLFNILLYFET
ncbi:unnamed protein product [Paramecium sonneborni]|uniref:Uncharacterized protein n=1 Tax=Paramecium sonneborni TaxID=65129 RepID=A0A8S1KPM4_9CILI|nr:unnamed protein product [Paramecium sonneborni]